MDLDLFDQLLEFNVTTFNSTSILGFLNETLYKSIIESHFRSDGVPKTENIILVILYVPVFLLGVFGNGMLTIIIITRRQIRSVTNILLCNLAVADLGVTIICIPIAVGNALHKVWIYGEFMCKLTGFLQGVSVAASVFTIALLSVDRFLAIKHPMVFRRVSTNRVAIKLIIVVWITSLILMSPLLYVRQMSVIDLIPTNPVYFCGEIWPHEVSRRQYDIVLFVIFYVIPGAVVCTTYGMIGSELWKEDKDLKRTESETSRGLGKQMMRGRKRVAKMLIALAILFAFCWLPYHSVSLYLDFHSSNRKLLDILPYTIFLGHSNSAFNPILYFYSSRSFRCFLVRMLRCKKKRYKPVRQENLIVRCTRDNNTTTALTRRPFVRILSSSSLTSRSGSVKFSRSSNTSLRSSSGKNSFRSSSGKNSYKSSPHRRNELLASPRSPKNKTFDKNCQQFFSPNICPEIAIIETSYNDNGPPDQTNEKSYHKKAFMEATISIPTTINEESSRHNSLVPPIKPTPSPSIEAIYEESIGDSTSNSNDRERNRIEMKKMSSCKDVSSNMDGTSDEPSPSIEASILESTCFSCDKERNSIEMTDLSKSNYTTSNIYLYSNEQIIVECNLELKQYGSNDSGSEISH